MRMWAFDTATNQRKLLIWLARLELNVTPAYWAICRKAYQSRPAVALVAEHLKLATGFFESGYPEGGFDHTVVNDAEPRRVTMSSAKSLRVMKKPGLTPWLFHLHHKHCHPFNSPRPVGFSIALGHKPAVVLEQLQRELWKAVCALDMHLSREELIFDRYLDNFLIGYQDLWPIVGSDASRFLGSPMIKQLAGEGFPLT